MAFTVSSLSSFTEKATELLYKSTFISDDYQRYHIEDDVQGSRYINKMEVTLYPLAGGCSTTGSGGTVFSQATISVVPIKYQPTDYCFEDFQAKAIPIDRQAIARGLEDGAWMNILTEEHINQIKLHNERLLFVGATSSGDLFNGWATQAFAASDRVMIDGSLTAYTIANYAADSGATIVDDVIQGFCNKAYETAAILAAINSGKQVVIHVPAVVYNAYKRYLTANNAFRDANKALNVNEMYIPSYEGQISIKMEPSLADSTTSNKPKMFATYDKNLVIGTSLVNNLQVPYAKWIVNEEDDYVRFKSSLRLGATIAYTDLVITNY